MKRRTFIKSSICASGFTLATPFIANASVFDNNQIVSTDPNSIRRGDFGEVYIVAGGEGVNIQPYAYSIIKDPTGSAPTKNVERYELRYRDYWEFEGWAHKHRIQVQGGKVEYNSEQIYEWNFFVEEDFLQGLDDICHIGPDIFDHSGNHGYSNPIMFSLHGYRRSVFRLSTIWFNGHRREIHKLVDWDECVNKWVNVKWQVKWNENGFHRIWVNDDMKINYNGFTLRECPPMDFPYGLYRGEVDKWERLNGRREQPKKILYSGFASRTL